MELTEDKLMRRVDLSEHSLYLGGDRVVIELYDIGRIGTEKWGRSMVGYRLLWGDKIVMEGDDYSPSPMEGVDSDSAVISILSFATSTHDLDSITEVRQEFIDMVGDEVDLARIEFEEAEGGEFDFSEDTYY